MQRYRIAWSFFGATVISGRMITTTPRSTSGKKTHYEVAEISYDTAERRFVSASVGQITLEDAPDHELLMELFPILDSEEPKLVAESPDGVSFHVLETQPIRRKLGYFKLAS